MKEISIEIKDMSNITDKMFSDVIATLKQYSVVKGYAISGNAVTVVYVDDSATDDVISDIKSKVEAIYNEVL